MSDQKGAIPILLLVAIIGVISVLAISSIAPFRDGILNALFPKNASQAAVDEWTQDGHDAQRTGVTSEEPVLPWTYLWSFNGSDATGSASAHKYDAPKEARIVTGGSYVYVPAGIKGLYALSKTNGSIAWNITNTSFNASPVYDPTSQTVFAGGADGQVYKINANTGSILGTFNTGSPVNKALLLTGGYIYSVSNNGNLNKIAISNVAPVWTYTAGSAGQTPVSYSSIKDVLVYATADLNVHAVNNSNGSLKWKVKPTPNNPGDPAAPNITTVNGTKLGTQFEFGWPVIAEQHGVVFVRIQLPHKAMNSYNGNTLGIFPTDQSVTRQWLINNPGQKNLFALNLDDGSEKFIPAVGYGSTEDYLANPPANMGNTYGVMGSMPIVKVFPDGKEVVYIHFRNGQSNPPDYRWDSGMGEMVLDDTTITGLKAGDLRFVKMNISAGNGMVPMGGNSYTYITDEQTPLSLAGTTLFNAHWAASTSVKITDRSPSRGLTYADPITTTNNMPVIRAQKSCSNFNPVSHSTTCALQYVTDGGRYFSGPGFWGYWNVVDPPGWRTGITPSVGSSYSSGVQPRYTFVSDGLIIVEGNGGDLIVFKHSGTTTQNSPTPPSASSVVSGPISPSPAASVSNKLGDLDANGKVDIFDYNALLTNFGKSGASLIGDIDKNGKVDIFDYNILLTNFGK